MYVTYTDDEKEYYQNQLYETANKLIGDYEEVKDVLCYKSKRLSEYVIPGNNIDEMKEEFEQLIKASITNCKYIFDGNINNISKPLCIEWKTTPEIIDRPGKVGRKFNKVIYCRFVIVRK